VETSTLYLAILPTVAVWLWRKTKPYCCWYFTGEETSRKWSQVFEKDCLCHRKCWKNKFKFSLECFSRSSAFAR